jgi:hypothetical protein
MGVFNVRWKERCAKWWVGRCGKWWCEAFQPHDMRRLGGRASLRDNQIAELVGEV